METPVPSEYSGSDKKSRTYKYILVILVATVLALLLSLPNLPHVSGSGARSGPLEPQESVAVKIATGGNRVTFTVTNIGLNDRAYAILLRFTDRAGKQVGETSIRTPELAPRDTFWGSVLYPEGATAAALDGVGVVTGSQIVPVDYAIEHG